MNRRSFLTENGLSLKILLYIANNGDFRSIKQFLTCKINKIIIKFVVDIYIGIKRGYSIQLFVFRKNYSFTKFTESEE